MSRACLIVVSVASLVGVCACLGSAGGAAARPAGTAAAARAVTLLYIRQTKVEQLEPRGPRFWELEPFDGCNGYEAETANIGAQRRAIWVHHWDGVLEAYARQQSRSRWLIRTYIGSQRAKSGGYALRRSATRWDVIQRSRTIGYAVGPDGPVGAAMFLAAC